MKVALLLACTLAAVAAVLAQPNTPSTFNQQNNHRSNTNPCQDINVQGWQDVPANRVTVDPHFDEGVPADYACLWTGRDNENYFPNGFRKGQVYEDNNPPFCFNVYGVQNKQIQLMLQTVDDQARLCVKDINTNTVRMGGSIDRCFTDKHVACFGGMTYSDTVTLMVYVDSTGTTTATPFWYRIRRSDVSWDLTDQGDRANSAVQTLEMWCMMQDQQTSLMQFPKDLRSPVMPEAKVVIQSGASATSVSVGIIAMLALVAAFFARQ